MYVACIPNRSSPPAFLLRESFRVNGKVKNRTLANLSHWDPVRIAALRRVLKSDLPGLAAEGGFEILRSRPHGHVAAVLGTARKVGLPALLAPRRSRYRDLCLAMIVARILEPRSKLATAQALRGETLQHTLGEVLDLGDADEDELYRALDWLLARQGRVEGELAKRHLQEGTLVLYDLTSVWLEGRTCPLGRLGHSRDNKKGKLQIVVGLLCDPEGRPVAVEVWPGNTQDATTVAFQVRKLRQRFGIRTVVFVGDRGTLTAARIREDLATVDGVGWITALRAPEIRFLVEQGTLQLSLFDQRDLAEIAHAAYPGERLVVCRNPLLAVERARKREDLLRATERELERVAQATRRPRRPLRGKDRIGLRVGRVLHHYKVGKHFDLAISEEGFTWKRREDRIAAEAAMDGIYVIRSRVSPETLGADGLVRSYKALSYVERAFRSCKTVDLRVRPVFHRKEDRVRAHVFVCMLAYYVEWHMRRALGPLLFDDTDRQAVEAERGSVVAPAPRSKAARAKDYRRRTPDDFPVQSFQSLLHDLATLTRNRVRLARGGSPEFDKDATPTPVQARALELLGVPLRL